MKECKSEKIDSENRSYSIKVQGHLGDEWSEWFNGLKIIREENGISVLSGIIPDQSELYGIIKKLGNLGINLISINNDQ